MPARLSDAYKNHAFHYFDQKHLPDLQSAKELPEAYAWSSSLPDADYNRPSITPPDASPSPSYTVASVPVIDLADDRAQELIGQACKTWGVFQVVNHGVASKLLDEVETQGRKLFALPMHRKLMAARTPHGVSGYGPPRISSFFPKLLWSEGFTIFGSPHEHARRLWPKHYHTFCDTITSYEKNMKQLAGNLMNLLLATLGAIPKQDLPWSGPSGDFTSTCAALQLNSYPTCPDPVRAMGLAAHTDSTLLTILHQSQSATGLQVQHDGKWVNVPPVPGALVVNIGDLLHILSNGRYPSVVHRAVVNGTHHRLSMAYLYGPPVDVKIYPLPCLVDDENPSLYRPVSWTEYLAAKAEHFDKALVSVRVCAPGPGGVDDPRAVEKSEMESRQNNVLEVGS